jgi:hypothetical protein
MTKKIKSPQDWRRNAYGDQKHFIINHVVIEFFSIVA